MSVGSDDLSIKFHEVTLLAEKVTKELEDRLATIDETIARLNNGGGPLVVLKDFTKAYMQAVAKTDGLFSVKPSVVKALEQIKVCESKPTPIAEVEKRIKVTIDLLQKLSAELKKDESKLATDAKKKEKLKTFLDFLENKMVKRLKSVLS
jgi:hypothetical protein